MEFLPGLPPNRYGSWYCVTRYIAHLRERRKGQFVCHAIEGLDFRNDRYIAGNCYSPDSGPVTSPSHTTKLLPKRKSEPSARRGVNPVNNRVLHQDYGFS